MDTNIMKKIKKQVAEKSAQYRGFRITARHKGFGMPRFMKTEKSKHVVTVEEMSTGNKIKFVYWENMITKYLRTDDQLVDAFKCFVADAMAGELDYDEFCSEFGYETFYPDSVNIWEACKKQTEKLRTIYDDHICGLLD